MAAVEILLLLRVEVVVAMRKPRTIRRVVEAHVGQVMVVGEGVALERVATMAADLR